MQDPPLLRCHGEKSVSAITAKSEADITTSASAIMSHADVLLSISHPLVHESRILRCSPIAGRGYFVVGAAHSPSFSSRRKPIASVIAARRGYFVVATAHSPSFSSRRKPITFVIAARRGYFMVAAAHSPSFLAREPPAEGKFPPLDLVTSHINRRRLDNTSEDKKSIQMNHAFFQLKLSSFFMAGKRKRSGRSVIDVIRERAGSSAMHDSPLRDRGRRVHLQSQFGSTSSLPLHDASHSSSSGDVFQANGNSNHSHCAPSVPIEHHNRADFPSCLGSNVNTSAYLKKGRGRSKPIARWNKDGKLQLELTLDGEIDGPDRVEFKTQLGVMARNAYRFPLIYTSFDCMPLLLLDDLWSEVKKWKQGKYELKKKYFKPYQNDPEKLKELTVDLVPPEQFKYLVDYWKLVETQILLIEGKFPSRIDIFCESCPVTSETSNLIKQMRDSISRVPEAEHTAELEERVWIEFMGEDGHGRVKCAGRGIKPSKRRHTLSSNEVIKKKIQEVVQEVEEKMRGEKEQMRKEIDEMKEEREKMKGLMEQMEKKMSQTREEMTQEVVENVVSYFGLGHFPVAPFIGQSAATF
ncbi:hypothetical protein BUALT_Bualt17G0033600 [Buddleja alternifolia]|uniref:Uncharacterized protein n=1 Tax=Buddleja alternifolia TaxID=168488 RepID=A0AAV6W5Z3_9LAMI|nr:hypothetical protein BUALT_Bualt17G0033600 [Buddleja alternifolia]